jgi:hypothetical protein
LTATVTSADSITTDSAGTGASGDSTVTGVSAAGIEDSAAGIEGFAARIEGFAARIEDSGAASAAFVVVTMPSRQTAGSTVVEAEASSMVEGVAAMVVANPAAGQLMVGK